MGERETVRVRRDGRGVAWVTMDRPQVRNAFDDRLVGELSEAAAALGADGGVRAVVLTGAGDVFSAGADLRWLRSATGRSVDDSLAEAGRLERLLRALWDLPKPLIGRINGHAFGGGVGLVAVCDLAVAVRDAVFGFTEVRLGLAPAVVAPYVVRKVGRSFARSAFVTGARFDAGRAMAVGLVHQVVADGEALDAAVAATLDTCLRAGPRAAAAAKRLPEVALLPLEQAAAQTVRINAELRTGDEGQEGMRAFIERRPASWVPEA